MQPSNSLQPDYWSSPTFQDPYAVQEINPEVADTQENAPTFESWSREPELGSWSPVFNHDDESFANSTQEVPSTLPQPLQVADSTQEPQINSLRPSEELDAHVPQQQGRRLKFCHAHPNIACTTDETKLWLRYHLPSSTLLTLIGASTFAFN